MTNCTSENLAYVLPRSPTGSHRPKFKMFLIWFSLLRESVGKIKNIFVQFVLHTLECVKYDINLKYVNFTPQITKSVF